MLEKINNLIQIIVKFVELNKIDLVSALAFFILAILIAIAINSDTNYVSFKKNK